MTNFDDVLISEPPQRHTNEKTLGDKFKDVAGGALGIGSSLVTSFVNNALAQSNAREQRLWQEKMWRLQNEYNTPGAMASRMKEAGLNPYTITGAQPAGSAGQGAMAQTMPVESPLAALKTYSDIKLTNATTGKTETETEKLLLEMDALDLAYQRGLLEFEDYRREFYKKWKYFEEHDTSPTEVSTEHTISETKRNNAQADLFSQQLAESEQKVKNLIAEEKYTEALTATENFLREAEKAYKEAATEDAKASAYDHYKSAELKRIQAICEANDEKRKQALHPGSMEAQRLENAIKRHARDKGATESQMRELDLYMQQLWSGKKHDYTWNDVGNMLLDFIHHNISLFGGANHSKSYSNVISDNTTVHYDG